MNGVLRTAGDGVVVVLAVVLAAAPALGYETPSPRLPGEDEGGTAFAPCPEHGPVGRLDKTGTYSCPRCGRELAPPSKR